MEQTLTCTSCGTRISNEARFCRNCGQPSGRFDVPSVTDGTTRLLETQDRPAAAPFDQGFPYAPLAYQVGQVPQAQATTTRSLEPPRKPHNRMLLAVLIGAIVVLMVGALLSLKLFSSSGTARGPKVVVVGPQIEAPPPPPPPQPPALAEGSGISPSLIYPDAQVTMQIIRPDEGNVLQLQTTDAPDKVIRWYTERLKPTKIVRMPGNNAVLEAEDVKAIINGGEGGTSIFIKQGED